MSVPKLPSKSLQMVKKALKEKGLEFQVIEFSESTRTAQEAATAIGCEVAQIAKSLIFKTSQTHRPILVLASGVNRVNEKSLRAYIGEKLEKADAVFIRNVTGFAIGGVPPLGHKELLETYIDEDLFLFEELWAAAGTHHTVFKLPSKLLIDLTQGKVISIK